MDEPNVIDGADIDTPVDIEASTEVDGGGDVAAELTKFLTEHSASEGETTEDEPTRDKPEPKVEDDKKVEAKTDEKVPDKEPEPEEDEDEDALLTKEQIDAKYPNASKAVRAYADRVSRQFEAVKPILDELGGVEGVQKLQWFGKMMRSQPDAEGKVVDEMLTQIGKLNPALNEAIQTHVFYGAIDTQPELLTSLITANMGKDWTQEDLIVLSKAREAGHIDMDEIKELVGTVKLPEAVQKRIDELEAKVGKSEEILSRGELQERQSKVTADIQLVSTGLKEIATPTLAKYHMLPEKDDPEPVKQDKAWIANRMDRDIRDKMNANEVFQQLYAAIQSQNKGENFILLQNAARNVFKGIMRETVLEWAPYLTARIKSYGKVGENIEAREPLPEDARDAGGKITEPIIPPSPNGNAASELVAAMERYRKLRENQARAS